MKQVISLGSGLSGAMSVVQSVPDDPNAWVQWVQSTAVDRHNFKGSLEITLECLKALRNCRWDTCVAAGDFAHVINLQKTSPARFVTRASALMSGQELHCTEWPVCKCLMPSSPKTLAVFELLKCHANSQWNLITTRSARS